MDVSEFPKLRSGLEAVPFEHDGKQMYLLRDRAGYTRDNLVFSPQVVPILVRMDGSNSLRDLQTVFMRHTGQLLYLDHLTRLVRTLDEHYFLENARFRRMAAAEAASFADSPLRPMYHAGVSYPADPEELRARLASYFLRDNGGPGLPAASSPHRKKLMGLVAPHIDLGSGGPCFAHAYKTAAESRFPDTWIILGTGHDPVENCFALTRKDFETPLGTVRCNREICDELAHSSPVDLFASEYNHKIEHTIEFQAVFLCLVQPSAQIVPVLCSFGGETWSEMKEYVDSFALKLAEIVLDPRRCVGILASVDLAHVGPRYGDPAAPVAPLVRHHLSRDALLLKMLEGCRYDDFIDRIECDDNSRKICGVAPLYLLARSLHGHARGTTLDHTHALVDEIGSFVTFASMAFFSSQTGPDHE